MAIATSAPYPEDRRFARYTAEARQSVTTGCRIAQKLGAPTIGSMHVLLGIIATENSNLWIRCPHCKKPCSGAWSRNAKAYARNAVAPSPWN